jgi:hypothetical protein
MTCYFGYDMAISKADEPRMIYSFLLLALLGIGSVMFWIAWWAIADLLTGSRPPAPLPIKTAEHKPRLRVRPSDISPTIKRVAGS